MFVLYVVRSTHMESPEKSMIKSSKVNIQRYKEKAFLPIPQHIHTSLTRMAMDKSMDMSWVWAWTHRHGHAQGHGLGHN